MFDFQCNILTTTGPKNEQGEETKVPLSHNVRSVTPVQALVNGYNVRGDFIITYETALPNADYVWLVAQFDQPGNGITGEQGIIYPQVRNDATYGSSVTVNDIKIRCYPKGGTTLGADAFRRTQRLIFQAYTIV